MKFNTVCRLLVGTVPPPIPIGLFGVEAFAELLVKSREIEPDRIGPISDEGLRRLLSLVYYASLLTEEGQFLQYKIVCEAAEGSFFLIAKVHPEPLETVQQLKRLAPACVHPECAILVGERDGSLWIEGIMNAGNLGFATPLGHPGVVGVGKPIGLKVEVRGPGHLRVTEGGIGGYEICAGKIRPLCAYDSPEPVRTILQDFSKLIASKLEKRLGQDADQWKLRTHDLRPIQQLLSKLLRIAVAARHGAAFVILPEGCSNPDAYGLNVLHRTDLNLGQELVEHWMLCLEYAQSEHPAREAVLHRAERQRSKLIVATEAVGHFSAVDGCVVLNRDFNILGFGAKIDAPFKDSQTSVRRFKHIASGEVFDDRTVMTSIGGTRHQSAARLCQIHPGMMVFTVSQDGDLKLFCSDSFFAYVFGPLDLPTIENELWVG